MSRYLIASSIAAGLLLLLWLVKTLLARKLRNAASTATSVDDFFLLVAQKTKLLLLVIPCVYAGARTLALPKELHAPLHTTMLLALIAQVTLWVTAVVDFWLRRYRRTRIESDPASVMTINAFRIAAIVSLWIFAGVLAIHNLGFDVTALIAGLGIGGVAVALATQNILADLFASLSIVIDKPFILGDSISVDKQSGTVEHIGLKTTRLRASTGEQVIFSNGDLLKSRIQNFTRMRERRSTLRIAVGYGTTSEQLATLPALLRNAVEKQERARFDRAHLISLGEQAYELEVTFLTPSDYASFLDIQQAVMLDIIRTLESEKLMLAERERMP
ncbi:MAG TPA: mechanosensitive ion channel family protein [Thermoanaerobaculia bacterium]|nr:mechanosensitive ion channel family protein [Thermoanaerobaculia bacterium]